MGGVQVPKKPANKWLFNLLLKKTKHIFARDMQCVDELKKYGFQEVSFFMDTAYFSFDWSKFEKEKKSEPSIIINLNYNAKHFYNDICQDIESYNKQ